MENKCLYCNLLGHDIEECKTFLKHRERIASAAHDEVQRWNENHSTCPNCGNSNVQPTTHTTEYIIGEDYEDRINTAKCILCDWNGYTHELKSKTYGEFVEKLREILYRFIGEQNDNTTRTSMARAVSILISSFISEGKMWLENKKFEIIDNTTPDTIDGNTITMFIKVDGKEMMFEEFMKKYLQ